MKTLKKIYRSIKAFFKAILKWFDKNLITPITKFVLLITEKTGKRAGYLERWLSRKNTLIFLSLLLSIGLFLYVDNKSTILIDSAAEVMYDQKVDAIYNEEAYVIEGLPETADVTLIGRRVDLYLAKQISTSTISVDLSDLKEGTHKVSLNYETSVNFVSYKLDPSTVTVIIYPKVSETREVNVDVLNASKLDTKLSIQKVEVSQNEVIIKGAEHVLKQVATVKALVDISNIIDPEAGVTTLDDVKLVAYDTLGNVVDVEIVPDKISATISIVSPSKEVPIKVIPNGSVVFGKAISSISSSVSKVTIYGDDDIINEIQYIPIEIDVTDLAENKTYNVVIEKPSGIRYISQTKTNVTVSLDNEVSMEVKDIFIETINLDSNYKAVAIGEESSKTTVVIKGTQEVLDAIDLSTIKATVDLSGLGEGDHTVEVTVTGDDVKATYTPKTTKIKVRITKK